MQDQNMNNLDYTTLYEPPAPQQASAPTGGSLIMTVFDGLQPPQSLQLESFHSPVVTFGRGSENMLQFHSKVVSAIHGRFRYVNGCWVIEDKGVYADKHSTNRLLYNNMTIDRRVLSDGDFIRIDDRVQTVAEGVLLVFSSAQSPNRWKTLKVDGRPEYTIGRDPHCDIHLPHISVSKHHARIIRRSDGYYICDNNSTNGVVVNGRRLQGQQLLHEKDVIVITNSRIVFSTAMISYCCYQSGISVDAVNVLIRRGKGRKGFVTGNNITMNIRPGELVAIIGGSGAGKSTILNALCGYLPPNSGNVFINGVDLYQNFDTMKKLIGYVPQSDIVYDNLTLHDMLKYTASLRLPKDTAPAEKEAAIDRAIRLVELTEKKNSYIKSLSGGQRKRASIAVELLSDPKLLFLDEPASGLDPGTERNLMMSLRSMADNGKTVILVTHSTLQLKLCDKIAFMGKGGNLCFLGSYDEALSFFGVQDVVDVYNMITENAPEWRGRYDRIAAGSRPSQIRPSAASAGGNSHKGVQLPVLCRRYMKLVVNDRQRLLLLLVQAPLLALLISLVADGDQFERYEMTKSLLFALSCSAFWVGMLNAIQEICKERTILKREYMTGLSLNSYILSKIIVLGIMCLIQSLMIVLVFSFTVGLPEEGLFLSPFIELLITVFLTAIASSAMGLFVSSLFTNADRAMTVAPILLMPQILFSGLIFTLEGATKIISWFAVCRWSMEALGVTADLNELPKATDAFLERETESFFDFTVPHMLADWGILIAFVVLFLLGARFVLRSINKEKS